MINCKKNLSNLDQGTKFQFLMIVWREIETKILTYKSENKRTLDQNTNIVLCRYYGPNFLQTFYPTLKSKADILGLNAQYMH